MYVTHGRIGDGFPFLVLPVSIALIVSTERPSFVAAALNEPNRSRRHFANSAGDGIKTFRIWPIQLDDKKVRTCAARSGAAMPSLVQRETAARDKPNAAASFEGQ